MTTQSKTPAAPTWKQKASRWWYVVRYYRPSQLAWRLITLARKRLHRLTRGRRYARPPAVLPKLRENPGFEQVSQFRLAIRRAADSADKAAEVLAGRFRFLNEARALPDPIDWRLESSPEASQLWRYHLHYHEFLLDLAAEGVGSGDPAWFDRAWRIVDQWIEGNPLSDPRVLFDAWQPYCISRRLPVWCFLWSIAAPPDELRERILGSMFCQARYLATHLEKDLGSNHLFENVRALTIVGAFLDGPDADRWLHFGAKRFRKQVVEQVLPSGEHYERSPMYHTLMLEAVLDVRDVARAVVPELSDFCAQTAKKMAAFARQILHPDGQIPLLGDSCLDEAAHVGSLIARAGGADAAEDSADEGQGDSSERSPRGRAVGDYWVYRDGRDFLLFDAGPVGVDHMPAHAHADLLSLEASIDGRRVFVDSGVFNYLDDEMRRYCRGSAAHNVLTIDDTDQCDVWSKFRMGYRGWPQGLTAGESNGFHWGRASHNAYRRLGVPLVGRWIACRPGGPWFCVDWAEGTGSRQLANRLHLHPDLDVEQTGDGEIRIVCSGVELRLRPLTPGSLELTSGWYCPQLGLRLPCPVVQWTAAASLPSTCGWYLAWGKTGVTASLSPFAAEKTVLQWMENDQMAELFPMGGSW